MKHFPSNNRPMAGTRRGFTLLEVLVVMGIIVFLVSITVNVVTNAISASREKKTIATIRKIDGLLSQRLDAFTIGLKAQNLKAQSQQAVIQQKNLFRNGFPQTLEEAGVTPVPTNDDPATQSSEAMYLFLTTMPTFDQPPVDANAFSSQEVMDTDGDGYKEFVDGWGRPLRFYRWPTRLIRPAPKGQESQAQTIEGTAPDLNYKFPLAPEDYLENTSGYDASELLGNLQPAPSGAASRKTWSSANPPLIKDEYEDPLAKDPDDPKGILTGTANATGIQNFENDYHTPDTWHTPLILSVGQDGILGLYEPTDKTNHGNLAQPNYDEIDGFLDNITNRNIQP